MDWVAALRSTGVLVNYNTGGMENTSTSTVLRYVFVSLSAVGGNKCTRTVVVLFKLRIIEADCHRELYFSGM